MAFKKHLIRKITRQILLFYCIILLSCNSKEDSSTINSPQEQKTMKFIKEIPVYKDGQEDLFYKLKKQKKKHLKLDNIEDGYDSLQIRIWYDYALLENQDLVVIKCSNGKWEGIYDEMIVKWDATYVTDSVISDKIKPYTPKIGWDNFIRELMKLKIITLPNIDYIPGLIDDWDDGVTYIIEVASKTQYRFYSYHLPEKFENKFWQARNMVNILDLIGVGLKM
jgi:hypothetical protein